MFYVGQSLTDNLSVEAFYQIEWDPTVVENCGTFFSQPDVVAPGCDENLRVLSPALGALAPYAAAQGFGYEVDSEGVKVARGQIATPKMVVSGASPSATCSSRWTPSLAPTS